MINDQIRHQIHFLPQFFDIRPTSQAGINPGMIDWVIAGIHPITGIIEGQDMDSTEKARQWPIQQSIQRSDIASSQAICIRDQVYFVSHAIYLVGNGLAAKASNLSINPS